MQTWQTQKAFTLIEVVVSIIVLGIALTALTALFFANPGRTLDPLMQARSSEFAQGLMEEILAKRFDENTPVGGLPPCGTVNGLACSTSMGSDGESRDLYDDVDDYSNCGVRQTFTLQSGSNASGYDNRFQVEVCVDYYPTAGTISNRKRIALTVFAPQQSDEIPIDFTAIKGNF